MLVTVRIEELRILTKTYNVDYDFEAVSKAKADYLNNPTIMENGDIEVSFKEVKYE